MTHPISRQESIKKIRAEIRLVKQDWVDGAEYDEYDDGKVCGLELALEIIKREGK